MIFNEVSSDLCFWTSVSMQDEAFDFFKGDMIFIDSIKDRGLIQLVKIFINVQHRCSIGQPKKKK